jgi:hypothetical protein
LSAQQEDIPRDSEGSAATRIKVDVPTKKFARRTATIHWQRVPLGEAIGRLRDLFDDAVFVDRRVDPTMRVTLDIESASAEEVVAAVANAKDLGVARLGSVVYLGPSAAAGQLRAIAVARMQDAKRLPADVRPAISERRQTTWERLAEPRRVIKSAAEERGWRIANAETIPHDLWSSGRLPALSLTDQLTVLLVGFDLTFKLQPQDQSIEIVPLKAVPKASGTQATTKQSPPSAKASKPKQGARQQYTLRVQEQRVGAVLETLANRLNWTIQIDEVGIRKAGKSLDTRVSFSVNKADQDQLLEALLKPAGLDFRVDGDRVRIIAERYGDK